MNSLALQNTLEKLNVETRVMSAFPIQSICETYIRRRAIDIWKKIELLYVQQGLNPYFSTDTAASLRAAELKCSKIYKATKVDGIYDKDPNNNKNAKMLKIFL